MGRKQDPSRAHFDEVSEQTAGPGGASKPANASSASLPTTSRPPHSRRLCEGDVQRGPECPGVVRPPGRKKLIETILPALKGRATAAKDGHLKKRLDSGRTLTSDGATKNKTPLIDFLVHVAGGGRAALGCHRLLRPHRDWGHAWTAVWGGRRAGLRGVRGLGTRHRRPPAGTGAL